MKLRQKLIATILTVMMLTSYLSILGNIVIAVGTNLSGQNSKTNHANVEFNSYFEGETHSKAFEIGKEAKLYIKVKVSNVGYLKNGVVKFVGANFEVDSNNLKSDKIQSSSKDEIKLKQINNSDSEVIIEVPITVITEDTVNGNLFNKTTTISFTGTYIDGNGKENSINKEISNQVRWQGKAEVNLEGEISKYIPYTIEEEKGVLIQIKIISGLKNNSLPIAKTKLEVSVPEIKLSEEESVKPTRVTAVADTTAGTNGKADNEFSQANYNYNEAENKIEIEVTNGEENGKISWKKKVEDKYLVNYIYTGEAIYNFVQEQLEKAKRTIKTEEEKKAGLVNENAITGTIDVKATIEAYNSEETKLEKAEKISYKIEEAKGNLIDTSINITSEISKGYIYANYAKADKESKKDTEYEVAYIARVYDKTLINLIEFEAIPEKYIDDDGNEYNTMAYSKFVKVSEAIFNKILGSEGKIEIADKLGNKIAEITKNTPKDQAKNYVANIIEANVNEIIIKTSKPITEGNIEVVVEKAISAEQKYTKSNIEDFKQITVGLKTKASSTSIEASANAKLAEPISKAQISIGTQNLSTIVKNKNVELRVVLDTSNNKNALYKNPELQIVLPENVENVELKGADLLLDDELKIKNTKVEEQNGRKVIVITLEGTQTKYMDNGVSNEKIQQNVIAKGANIVIKADIIFKKLAPSANSDILLYYTNDNSNLFEQTKQQNTVKKVKALYNAKAVGLASTNVKVVSPNGIITENRMSGYSNNATMSNIETEKQEQVIATHVAAKEVTIGGTIVNNYANSIENAVVLGRTAFSGNKQIDSNDELGSNFTMKMKSKITTSGIDESNIKIYYSINGEATKDLTNTENVWTQTPTNLEEVKSYLIIVTGEVETATQFSFDYKAELPADLSYSNSTYTTYKIYYNNKMKEATIQETKVAGTIGLTTGEGPDISIELKSTIDTVREGQIVKMKAVIKNTGSMIAKNVKVNISAPEDATLMEYVEYNWFSPVEGEIQTLEVGNIEPGKSTPIDYYIKLNEDIINEGNNQKEVINKITATADNYTGEVNSNECRFNVQKGTITLELINKTNYSIKKGEEFKSIVYVDKTVDTNLTNTTVTIPLPKEIEYKKAEIKNLVENVETTTEDISYNESTNTITVNIESLNATKAILITGEAKDVVEDYTIIATATVNGIEEHYSNVLEGSIEEINFEVSQLISSPKYVKEGETITYTLKLKNNNQSSITGIQVTCTLPEELNFDKATYTSGSHEILVTNIKDNKVGIYISLNTMEDTTIKVITKARLLPDKNDKEVRVNMVITANNYEGTTTNTVKNIIEYNQKLHEELEEENPTIPSNPVDPTNPENPTTPHYKITGTAWIDSNKDGKRDDTEQLLSGIQVMLIYKENSQIVKDSNNGEQKITTTDENGKYEFSNLLPDEYLVLFLYDTGKYTITQYQVKQVEESINSDVINMKVILNGEQRYIAVTDTIKIADRNVRDIDMGVYLSEKFDLRVDKYINKVTVTTPTKGTKVYNYNNAKLTKIDVYGKDIDNSHAVIEYKIVVTNEGQVAGYAKKLIDYLPDNVKFSSELNKDWYMSENNVAVYNTSLANEKIEPGQSKEVILILSISITEKMIGNIINNNAEIYESYNEQGLADIDSISANKLESEDDMSSADIMISIATGKIVIYITLILIIIILLSFGIFEIKKYVLNRKNN